uniref:HD domain-containing protein n=1 Tax=candidate division WOR-3 bacterium TaxID=2052148 RepID=A0A7C4XF82_UNCW3
MDKDYILKIFPEIDEIKNRDLSEGVIRAWLLGIEMGGWKEIEDIPFTLLIPTEKSLIEHTRSVTQMAMAIARVKKELNWDYIVAGGLVHDVGKLLEYEWRDGKFMKSLYGRLVRHPVSGYHLCLQAGLPLEIAHIVVAHSEEGEKVSRSPEAIVIHHCDFTDFEIEKVRV